MMISPNLNGFIKPGLGKMLLISCGVSLTCSGTLDHPCHRPFWDMPSHFLIQISQYRLGLCQRAVVRRLGQNHHRFAIALSIR
jgi:hypothetical protein